MRARALKGWGGGGRMQGGRGETCFLIGSAMHKFAVGVGVGVCVRARTHARLRDGGGGGQGGLACFVRLAVQKRPVFVWIRLMRKE